MSLKKIIRFPFKMSYYYLKFIYFLFLSPFFLMGVLDSGISNFIDWIKE